MTEKATAVIGEVQTEPDLKLRDVALRPAFYATSRSDLLTDFYVPCLNRAITYDRAVGFFRSSVLALTGVPFSTFAQRGGHARFVCSPDVTEPDAVSITEGYDARKVVDDALRTELEAVLSHPEGLESVTLLATLVAIGCVDIKVVLKKDGTGIFHHKLGVFGDADSNQVSFLGSTNESWSGWSPAGNHESFEVFSSWEEPARVTMHQQFFDSVWAGTEPELVVMDLPQAFREQLLEFGSDEGLGAIPRFVSIATGGRVQLFEHQEEALADWVRNGRRGILEHATGSGKTITALEAIRSWISEGRPALVVVPSDLLVVQWAEESGRYLRGLDPAVLLIGGSRGEASWRESLSDFTRSDGGPRLTITTLQSARSSDFLARITDPADLLVVVDEVHTAGSRQSRAILTIDAPARLGLSATPERAGDEEGTEAILNYFERKLSPIFTLHDAITAGRLTPYTYHVHDVSLTEDEQEEWDELTKKISREVARNRGADGSLTSSNHLEWLFMQRARIVKKAAGKVPLARHVLSKQFEEDQAWLVYCDDQEQLGSVLEGLRADDIPAYDYHSQMVGDRAATMDFYRRRGGVMVAIRCLDEGIDIPRVSHALILASSRNTREFIQRRGRVLRTSPGKYSAEIHDVLAHPSPSGAEHEASLVGPELSRAVLFARDAENRSTYLSLVQYARDLGVTVQAETNWGVEDE